VGFIYTNNNCISININEKDIYTDFGKIESNISIYNNLQHPNCSNYFENYNGVYKVKTSSGDKYIINVTNGKINSARLCGG
jgi:hypothetical protein